MEWLEQHTDRERRPLILTDCLLFWRQSIKDFAMEEMKHVDMKKIASMMGERSRERCYLLQANSAYYRMTNHTVKRCVRVADDASCMPTLHALR